MPASGAVDFEVRDVGPEASRNDDVWVEIDLRGYQVVEGGVQVQREATLRIDYRAAELLAAGLLFGAKRVRLEREVEPAEPYPRP